MKKNYYLLFITLVINCIFLNAQTVPVVQYPDQPSGLAFYEGILYIAEYDANSISKVDITNQNLPLSPESYITNLGEPYGLAINNNYLYTLDRGSLLKINLLLDEPTVETLASIWGYDLIFNDNILYISGNGSISKIDVSLPSPTIETIIDNIPATYIGMAIKDNYLYYSDYNNSIFKINLITSPIISMPVVSGLDSPRGLVFYGNDLYIAEYFNGYYDIGQISKIDITLSNPEIKLVTDKDLTGPWNLIIYENDLYISEFAISTISKIAISEPLSLENHFLINSIQIFPNPTNDYLILSGIENSQKYSIYETLGKKIIEGICSNNKKINIKNLNNGIYFIRIGNNKVMKFIKK